MKIDPLMAIDFYKADHRNQYPQGTSLVVANFTARSGKHASKHITNGESVVFFGLQAFTLDFLIDCWNTEFFQKDKAEVVKRYKFRMDTSLGPDMVSVDHIEALHDLGYLPVEIRALPEGTLVPVGVPVMTIHNTIPEFFWLPNYLESVISASLWKTMTCATTAYQYRKILDAGAELTGADPEFVKLQAHDFSFRGMSGMQDAAMSGMGHLLSFTGTDSVLAIEAAEQFYWAYSENEVVGLSVPATEHSVMCMGTQEDEIGTFRRLITELYRSGIVSIVSDTWDFWKVVTVYLPELEDEIMARDGKVVIRPDSGDPVLIICGHVVLYQEEMDVNHSLEDYRELGYTAYEQGGAGIVDINTHKNLTKAEIDGAVQCLWDVFGGTVTEQGFMVLDEHIGLIYGDSITLDRCQLIMGILAAKGFASSNVVLGVGSYTYQHVTRDTYGMAMKSTYGEVNGVGREIFKDPATDDGTKKSARGLLHVSEDLVLTDQVGWDQVEDSALKVVFRDGQLTRFQDFQEIRTVLHGDGMYCRFPNKE